MRAIFMGLMAFLLLPLGGSSMAGAQSASSDELYRSPLPLPPGAPGHVIHSASLMNAAALPDAQQNLLVLYKSISIKGHDIAVSGTIAIPKGDAPAAGWPVTTWTHGTTGIGPPCAPSRDTSDGPEHLFLGIKQVLMNDYVRRGYVVVATDYEGLGTPGPHLFLQGVSEGRGALDIVRAARTIDSRIGSRYVVVGHSQGGHADLFAAAIGASYAPELTLLGNVAIAPASHIGTTVAAMTVEAKPSYALGYAMYVLQSFSANHPAIDLKKILTQEALDHLPETRKNCITNLVSEGYWATAIPKEQFIPSADLTAVQAGAAANDPATLRVASPTLILQGMADVTVQPAWTDQVAHALCQNGTPLEYMIYPGADHETVVTAATADIAAWIDARFSDETPASNCAALPTVAGGDGEKLEMRSR